MGFFEEQRGGRYFPPRDSPFLAVLCRSWLQHVLVTRVYLFGESAPRLSPLARALGTYWKFFPAPIGTCPAPGSSADYFERSLVHEPPVSVELQREEALRSWLWRKASGPKRSKVLCWFSALGFWPCVQYDQQLK